MQSINRILEDEEGREMKKEEGLSLACHNSNSGLLCGFKICKMLSAEKKHFCSHPKETGNSFQFTLEHSYVPSMNK